MAVAQELIPMLRKCYVFPVKASKAEVKRIVGADAPPRWSAGALLLSRTRNGSNMEHYTRVSGGY